MEQGRWDKVRGPDVEWVHAVVHSGKVRQQERDRAADAAPDAVRDVEQAAARAAADAAEWVVAIEAVETARRKGAGTCLQEMEQDRWVWDR